MRIKEHMSPKTPSAIQEHIACCTKCTNLSSVIPSFKIIKSLQSKRDAEIAESLLIEKYQPVLNKQLAGTNGRSYLLNVFK